MKVTKFIKRKNKIIYNLTGIILVPEDQIVEVPKHKLNIAGGEGSCPYCLVYIDDIDCEDCPMAKANNECTRTENNTWDQLIEWVEDNTEFSSPSDWYQSIPEMVKLYKKYNKQFESID